MTIMLRKIFALFIVSIAVLGIIAWNSISSKRKIPSNAAIKYAAIGDSYTIGNGVEEEDRWPNILTGHLRQKGIDIELVANLAVSGYTVRDAIQVELPDINRIKPDLVTVLIGANDNFGQKETQAYRLELQELLDQLQSIVTTPKNIVLITIPDYSKSPALKTYQKENILKLIQEYNEVIKEEGRKRNLSVADIFPISQTMTDETDYIPDGLHPSNQGYVKWEKIIFPLVFDLLKK